MLQNDINETKERYSNIAKSIRILGDEGGGSLISPDGVAPVRIVGVPACLWYLPLHYVVHKKISCMAPAHPSSAEKGP